MNGFHEEWGTVSTPANSNGFLVTFATSFINIPNVTSTFIEGDSRTGTIKNLTITSMNVITTKFDGHWGGYASYSVWGY